MSTDTVEKLDISIFPEEKSDWEKMTPEQQDADIDKGIAEIKGEEPVQEETPVVSEEIPADDDAVEPEKEPEGKVVVEEPTEWLDDSTREFASAMGLTEEDLSSFGSKEELDRALKIIDRKAYEAGKAAQQPVETPKPVVKPVEKQDDPFADLTKYKLGEQFDEEAAKPINEFVEKTAATIKQLQERLSRFEQNEQKQAVENMRRTATESLHSLGHAELFGKPGEKPTKEQKANIEKAIEAHVIHASGLIAQGRNAAPTPEFLKAAVHLAFGDELTKQTEKQLTEKLRKQSKKITGGSSNKPIPKTKGLSTVEDALNDPELEKLFNDLVAENRG